MFLHKLENYVNGACFSKTDLLLSVFSKSLPYRKNSGQILALYNLYEKHGTQKQRIVVEPYTGSNKFVLQMLEYLRQELEGELFDAVVHGSLATGEVIGYSDFDALVILKDTVFDNKEHLIKVAFKLGEARKIMQEMDPLQHHGWFVLTESMLKNLPLTYFPPVLFNFSKSILHDKTFEFEIAFNEAADYTMPFEKLSDSLLLKLNREKLHLNAYSLKNFLSEFMLLPTFYIQARDRKGIFKKDSFDAARIDFTKEEWEIMDEISQIRMNWDYELRGFGKYFYKSTHPVVKLIMKKFSFGIEDNKGLPKDVKYRMLAFVRTLKARLSFT